MHITLHLTKNCNMRCDYCYSPPQSGHEMTCETALKAIDFAAHNSKENTGIVFFGGEPLLRKQVIHACIDKCMERNRSAPNGFHFKVSTNGLLLDPAFLAYARSVGLAISLSIDGIESAHNAHRKDCSGGSTFAPVVDKARLLLQYQPYASALMVISPETVRAYAESVEFLESLGFKYIIASINYAGHWQDEHVLALKKQYKKLSELYEQWTLQEKKFYFSPFERVMASHIRGKEHALCNRCALGLRQLSIAPDGRIFPCVQFVRDDRFCIGDIRYGLNQEKRNNLYRVSKTLLPDCASCAYNDRCENRCSCLNWQTTGNLAAISPILCETERVLIPIVDSLGGRLFKKHSPLFIQKHYNATYPFLSLLDDSFHANQ